MLRTMAGAMIAAGLILVLGAGVTAIASTEAGTSGKNAKFKPKKVAGQWKGRWKNETFNSRGASEMTLSTKGKGKRKKFIGVFDLSGSAFGCRNPPPRKRKMTKGTGPNTWNKRGFRVRYSNDHGPIKLTYKHKKRKISGSGVSPCSADIAYTFKGKMTNKKVTANVDITNGGEPFAKSNLKLEKR